VPVDATYLTANVRLLLPPDVLERVTSRALGAYVNYVLGDTSSIDPPAGLQPVADHVVALVRSLLPELIIHGRQVRIAGLAGFQSSLQSLRTQIVGGQADLAIPRLPVPPLRGPVSAVLTAGLSGDDRQVVPEQVNGAHREAAGGVHRARSPRRRPDPKLLRLPAETPYEARSVSALTCTKGSGLQGGFTLPHKQLDLDRSTQPRPGHQGERR
jgi:hypothetical protein